MGSRDLLLNSAPAYISQEWLQLESPVHAVCAVHSMQPLPNYFGVLFWLFCLCSCSGVNCDKVIRLLCRHLDDGSRGSAMVCILSLL